MIFDNYNIKTFIYLQTLICMKHSKIIFRFLFMILFAIFSGCAVEDLHEHQNNFKVGITSRKISFDEFKQHTKAFNLVSDLNKKQSEIGLRQYRIIVDTLRNFLINTDEGLFIEYADLHSFTFPITRPIDNGKLENLVLSYQLDGTYKSKILKYDLTAQEKLDLDLDQLQVIENPIVTIPLDNYNSGYVTEGCEEYTEQIFISCTGDPGRHSFADGTAGDCRCFTNLSLGMPPQILVVTRIKCITDNGSPGGGPDNSDGGFGNPYSGTGSDDSSYSADYPTAQTPVNDYNLGISFPVKSTTNEINIRNALAFYNSLSPEARAWSKLEENKTAYNAIIGFQIDNNWSEASKDFADDMIAIMTSMSTNNDDFNSSEILSAVIYAKNNNYLNSNLDSTFFNAQNSNSSLNLIDPIIALNFAKMFLAHCAILHKENPSWNSYEIFAQAYLDTVHLLLDVAGVVPAFGEVADITNGVIYSIQGQGAEATLSFASAIPIGGWFAAGVKFAKRADGLRFLVVGTNNLINFGAYNSKKFRAAIGLLPGDPRQAHHLIPREFANNALVQKAAKATTNQGFHLHSALNGIPMPTTNHLTGHNLYSQNVLPRLNYLNTISPTPQIAFQQINNYINDIKINVYP
jgi:hypothetical protein